MKIIYSVFSDQNEMQLEINRGKKTRKYTFMWKLNNTLLNNYVKNG